MVRSLLYAVPMITILLVIAGAWGMLSLAFVLALCVAARKRMPAINGSAEQLELEQLPMNAEREHAAQPVFVPLMSSLAKPVAKF